jgi:hypothetical protein
MGRGSPCARDLIGSGKGDTPYWLEQSGGVQYQRGYMWARGLGSCHRLEQVGQPSQRYGQPSCKGNQAMSQAAIISTMAKGCGVGSMQVLKQRHDLKLVVMSSILDAEKFQDYFLGAFLIQARQPAL